MCFEFSKYNLDGNVPSQIGILEGGVLESLLQIGILEGGVLEPLLQIGIWEGGTNLTKVVCCCWSYSCSILFYVAHLLNNQSALLEL